VLLRHHRAVQIQIDSVEFVRLIDCGYYLAGNGFERFGGYRATGLGRTPENRHDCDLMAIGALNGTANGQVQSACSVYHPLTAQQWRPAIGHVKFSQTRYNWRECIGLVLKTDNRNTQWLHEN
jgi:hypothetical protein